MSNGADHRRPPIIHVSRQSVWWFMNRTVAWRFAGFVSASLLMIAASVAFLFQLTYPYPRSSLIFLIPAPYKPPFSPLPWSQEDLGDFQHLDRQTLDLLSNNREWSTTDEGLRCFDGLLKKVVSRTNRPETVIVYVRMHSIVDGAGIPYLIPPGGSPNDPETWMSIRQLIDRFRESHVPDSINKLVILDCCDELVNWNQGLLFNTFVERIPAVISAAKIPNLSVITSAGPDEQSASSYALKHSVFSDYLQKGISGEADSRLESGNGDNFVSIKELHRYLKRQVNQWSLNNRCRLQQPILFSDNDRDFPVVSVFQSRSVTPSNPSQNPTIHPSQAVSDDDLATLWNSYRNLLKLDPNRFDPQLCSDIEQQIVWLEKGSRSGGYYAKASQRRLTELRAFFHAIQPQIEQLTSQTDTKISWSDWASLSKQTRSIKPNLHLSTVSLDKFFGISPSGQQADIAECLLKFQQSPTTDELHQTAKILMASDPLNQREFTNLFGLWDRFEVTGLWKNSTFLSSLVELHQLSESAIVPVDERVFRWIRPQLMLAEDNRRKIDDLAFLGGLNPETDLLNAKIQYQQLQHLGEQVAHAYSLHDHVAHELPYFAQWLNSVPLNVDDDASRSVDEQADQHQTLNRLIERQQLFGQILSQRNPDDELGTELSFQALVKEIETLHKELSNGIDAAYADLLTTTDQSANTWDRIHSLLSIPLLPQPSKTGSLDPVAQRIGLRKKRGAIEEALLQKFHSPKPQETASYETKDTVRNYLSELFSKDSGNRTLQIVLRPFDKSEIYNQRLHVDQTTSSLMTESKLLAELYGEQFRRWIRQIPELVHQDAARDAMATSGHDTKDVDAENLIRATASFALTRTEAVSTTFTSTGPITQRLHSNLHQMILWQAQRQLDDFWGSATSDSAIFFDNAAQNAIVLDQSIPDATAETQTTVNRLTASLDQRRVAARHGLETRANPIFQLNDDQALTPDVTVFFNDISHSLPKGKAGVLIRNGDEGRVSAVERLDIPWKGAIQSQPLPAQFPFVLDQFKTGQSTKGLKAITLFRGHEFPANLGIDSINGVAFDYQPIPRSNSKISVSGNKLRTLSIVFILDCSNSMGQSLPLETQMQNASRLQIAKLAIQNMLDKLALDNSHQVGVICLGHRVGWDLAQPTMLLKQKLYQGPIPNDLRPYEDVEPILPLGRFDSSFSQAVKNRLQSVRNWGESPLYLAMIQGLKQFQNAEPDSDKSLIVITDSMNYQFNPPETARKTKDDVMMAWNRFPVPIYVVGLGMDQDQANAQQEFSALASQTGGKYVNADTSLSLVESLESLRGLKQFRVADLQGNYQDSNFGQVVDVGIPQPDESTFDVSLPPATERISLNGGELIEMVPSRDGQRLEVLPYLVGYPQFFPLVRDDLVSPDTNLNIGVHRPVRFGRMTTFEFSVQHVQQLFVPRPVEVWIEVTPLSTNNQTNATYRFYDTNYQPQTSVPVLKWTVNDWPEAATHAKIQAWFRWEQSPGTLAINLKQAISTGHMRDVKLADLPGVTFQIDVKKGRSLQIMVIEQHDPKSEGLGTLKVSIRNSMTATRIRHQFDDLNRVAIHSFQISADDLDRSEILITKRTLALDRANRPRESIIVDVTESTNLQKVTDGTPGQSR